MNEVKDEPGRPTHGQADVDEDDQPSGVTAPIGVTQVDRAATGRDASAQGAAKVDGPSGRGPATPRPRTTERTAEPASGPGDLVALVPGKRGGDRRHPIGRKRER